MAYSATIFRLLIASPSDTLEYRSAIRQVMDDWSALNSEAMGVGIQPLMWERDAMPDAGERPQALLNEQLVERSDGLVAVFWTRLGSPTGESESGTVEEIEECIEAGKPVLLYFSSQPVEMDSVDADELHRLKEFKGQIKDRVLFDTFANSEELSRKLFAALTRVAREKLASDGSVPTSVSAQDADAATPVRRTAADPVAEVERTREIRGFNRSGSPRYATKYALVIHNRGSAAADDFVFRFEHPAGEEGGDEALPRTFDAEKVHRFAAGASLRYPLVVHGGTVPQFELVFTWREGEEDREASQTLRI